MTFFFGRSRQQMQILIAILGLLSGVGLAFLTGCATSTTNEGSQPSVPPTVNAYESTIDRYSAGDEEYNGFYNQFAFKATLQNSTVIRALLDRQGEYYKWEPSKVQAERDKAAQDSASKTEVFISFFTPERRNDNLADHKSIWRVFIDVDGQRYTGTVKKSKKLFAELNNLYSFFTRWNTPYVVSFPIPVAQVESHQVSLTITGPLGDRTVQFK
jgi:hypothetical protein